MKQNPNAITQSPQNRGIAYFIYGSELGEVSGAEDRVFFVADAAFPGRAFKAPLQGSDRAELYYYPFGYAFIGFSQSFTLTGSSESDEESLRAVLGDGVEKYRVKGRENRSRICPAPSAAKPIPQTEHVILAIESDGGISTQTIETVKRSLSFLRTGKAPGRVREHGGVHVQLKSKEAMTFGQGHGLIIAEKGEIDSYMGTLLLSLAIEERLSLFEYDVEMERKDAYSYSRYSGKASYKSLAVEDLVKNKSETVYNRTLTLAALSRGVSDPASFMDGGTLNERIFYAFEDEYAFEDRLEIASDCVETLQDLYDVCCDRISEFKYFFYGSILEIVIIAILLAELIVLVLEWTDIK